MDKSAVELVSEYIKTLIVTKQVKAGDRIPTENELCALVGVSRGSVREAIKVLEALGILIVRRGDGTFIAQPNSTSALEALLFKVILAGIPQNELIDFRVQIEISVVSMAISNATEEDIQRLQTSYDAFKDHIENGNTDYVRTKELDFEFHRELAQCTHNQLMKDIYLFSFRLFSPEILENYRHGQLNDRQEVLATLENHACFLRAIQRHDLFLGSHAVEMSTELWKKWIEYRNE